MRLLLLLSILSIVLVVSSGPAPEDAPKATGKEAPLSKEAIEEAKDKIRELMKKGKTPPKAPARAKPLPPPPTLDPEDGKLCKKGKGCGGPDNILCDYGLFCKPVRGKVTPPLGRCHPCPNKVEDGKEDGKCKNDGKGPKACDEGLVCAKEHSKSRKTCRLVCKKRPYQGDVCKEGFLEIPCGKNYDCLQYDPEKPNTGYCHDKNDKRISGEKQGCEGETKSTCAPGLKCCDPPKGKEMKVCSFEGPKDEKDKKALDKCEGEFNKDGVCPKGYRCAPTVNYKADKDGKVDPKAKKEGICKRLGILGDPCVYPNKYKHKCAEGYECVRKTFDPVSKHCAVKGKATIAKLEQPCGEQVKAVCGPGLECIDSKKEKGCKICVVKGKKEVIPDEKAVAKLNEMMGTTADKDVKNAKAPVPGQPPADKNAKDPAAEILKKADGGEKKADEKKDEKKDDAKADEKKGEEKKPEEKKDEKKPEEKKDDAKADEKKDEKKPEEKKDDAKADEKKGEEKKDEKKDDAKADEKKPDEKKPEEKKDEAKAEEKKDEKKGENYE